MTFHDGAAHEERIGPNRAATRLVIVNGLPGAGKSTLAAALARVWSATLFSKDNLKDVLAGTCPSEPDPSWLSREAEDLLWFLTARRPRVIIETWFGGPGRAAAVVERLHGCGILASEVVEVWCEVPVYMARDRFLARARGDASRHPRHLQAGAETAWWDTLHGEGPLGITDVVRVDTTAPLEDQAVEELLWAVLHRTALPADGISPRFGPPATWPEPS